MGWLLEEAEPKHLLMKLLLPLYLLEEEEFVFWHTVFLLSSEIPSNLQSCKGMKNNSLVLTQSTAY